MVLEQSVGSFFPRRVVTGSVLMLFLQFDCSWLVADQLEAAALRPLISCKRTISGGTVEVRE